MSMAFESSPNTFVKPRQMRSNPAASGAGSFDGAGLELSDSFHPRGYYYE